MAGGGCKLQPNPHRQETEAGPDETAEAEPNPVYCYFASEVPGGDFFLGSQGRDGVFFFFVLG